jgi:hypothetical protein
MGPVGQKQFIMGLPTCGTILNNYSEFPELLVLWPDGKPTGGDHCNGGLLAMAHFSSHYIPLLYARRKISPLM